MIPSLQSVSRLECESCELSKHSLTSSLCFRARSNKLFELIHSDVWGRLSVPNQGQFKYYILFVDDYNRMSWLYLMKERKEFFSMFLSFITEICTQYSATVKTFRSGNALEYTSSHFKQYFESRSIIHETSCAYTPNQNGVAEHKHKHLLEATRCLMFHMSVPKQKCPATLPTACYLINCLPSVSLDNKIPFQVLFPNQLLFSLKPKSFGCVCFVHILPTRRDKLFAESLNCVFLGYS